MTTAQFEAASIIDVIQRAEKAAPKVSESSERFAGMIIDVAPALGYAVVRTTNEKVYYREEIDLLEATGEREQWRVSSSYLSRILGTFKSGSGDVIDFSRDAGLVKILQGRKSAKLGVMPMQGYPEWFESDSTWSIEVNDLGAKIKLVQWACSKDKIQLSLRLTNEFIYGSDGYVMCRIPIDLAALTEPVTIEVNALDGLIPLRGAIGFKTVGTQILITPNEKTQIRCSTIGEPYPDVARAIRTEFEDEFRCNREELVSLLKTTDSVASAGKSEFLKIYIGPARVAAIIEADDNTTGVRDIIDVVGADHDMHEMLFNPAYLGNAIRNAPDDYITFRYNRKALTSVLIEGSSGYQCWVQPIKPGTRPV